MNSFNVAKREVEIDRHIRTQRVYGKNALGSWINNLLSIDPYMSRANIKTNINFKFGIALQPPLLDLDLICYLEIINMSTNH